MLLVEVGRWVLIGVAWVVTLFLGQCLAWAVMPWL